MAAEDILTPLPGIECLTYEDATILLNIQRLWIRTVQLIRNFFHSAVGNLPEQRAVANRLFIKLYAEIYDEFRKHFSEAESQQFLNYISALITCIWQLMAAHKNHDTMAVDLTIAQWRQIGGELAAFLSGVNPYYEKTQWNAFLADYVNLMNREIAAYLNGDYEEETKIYDEIEADAAHIASYIAMGIIAQRHETQSIPDVKGIIGWLYLSSAIFVTAT